MQFQNPISGVWPVLSRVMEIYASDSRIMERTCRTLRFVIRCIGTQSAPLVEPLVQRLVRLYIEHPHSCFLYLVSFMNYFSIFLISFCFLSCIVSSLIFQIWIVSLSWNVKVQFPMILFKEIRYLCKKVNMFFSFFMNFMEISLDSFLIGIQVR